MAKTYRIRGGQSGFDRHRSPGFLCTGSPAFSLFEPGSDRKSTRLNSSHVAISYAVFSLKKKKMMSEVDPLIKLQLIKQEHKDWNITDVKKATKSLYDGKRTRKSLQRCQHERHKINIARE